MSGVVPLHPQAVPGDPSRVRWVLPPGGLPFAGAVAAVPAALSRLLDDGVLAEVTLEPAAVVTRLAEGRAWRDDGAAVRSAVHAAVAEPLGWAPAGQGADRGTDDADDDLRRAGLDVLSAAVGPFARSHGGGIELVDVTDGVVRVRLEGACAGCSAADSTLRDRLEADVRRRCPALRDVVAVEPARSRRGFGLLPRR